MNPIISELNKMNPITAMLSPLYNAMRSAGNPMAALGRMAMQDERMQQVVNTINQYGGIQQAVYAVAQKQNANPNDALNQARQFLSTFNMK